MCTLVAKKGTAGWIVASNSDNPYSVQSQVVSGLGDRHTYIAVRVSAGTADDANSVPWGDMLTRGVNSAGLAFTYAYVKTASGGEYGCQSWTEDLLGRQSDCAGAIRVIQDRRAEILPGNYLLADSDGDALIVEVSVDDVAIVQPVGDILGCTNVWEKLDTTVADRWRDETASDKRATNGRRLAVASHPADLARDVLADHDGAESDRLRGKGGSICNHGHLEGTISSEILEPSSGRLWFSFGWPCGRFIGHEIEQRRSWGRHFAFDARDVVASEELTTPDGMMTPAGASLVSDVRATIAQPTPRYD